MLERTNRTNPRTIAPVHPPTGRFTNRTGDPVPHPAPFGTARLSPSVRSFCVSERRAVCHYSESTLLPDEELPPRSSSRIRGAAASRSRACARGAGAETSHSHRRRQRGEGASAAGTSGDGELVSSQVALKR